MNYFNDYKEIIESNYIDAKWFDCLASNEIPKRVSNLKDELNGILNNNRPVIEDFLKLLTELAIYKSALEVKMRVNNLKDPKEPSRKYVQVRGSVRVAKNKRIWVGAYIGTEKEVYDSNGKLKNDKFCAGREAVISKILERFKELHLV
jgi:hypothetical protein